MGKKGRNLLGDRGGVRGGAKYSLKNWVLQVTQRFMAGSGEEVREIWGGKGNREKEF